MRRILPYLPLGVVSVLLVVGLLVGSVRYSSAPDAEANSSPPLQSVVLSNDGPLPKATDMGRLAKDDPISFIEACIRRYRKEVKGYTTVLQKQERENGKLQPSERIEARYREKPRTVYMEWLEGAGRADRVLF